MKRTIRKDPKPGIVVMIPLPSGHFAYVCRLTYGCWIYGFLTDFPTKGIQYFSPDHWWKPISITRFRVDMPDVCLLDLTPDQLAFPPTVQVFQSSGKPPRYLVTDPRFDFHDPRGRYQVSPDDACKYHRYMVRDAPDAIQFIVNHEAELRFIHVPIQERTPELASIAPKDESGRMDEEPRLIEVNFSGTEGMKVRDPAEIEEYLADELEKHECGEITGGGALTGGPAGPATPLDVFDFAIEAEPGQATKAIRCIQRVLTRLKAPATTEILEHHPQQEDPIRHPLQPPLRKKTKTG